MLTQLKALAAALVFPGFLLALTTSESAAGLQLGASAAATSLLPDARPGECYAKVTVPAEYKTVTEQVVTKEATEAIEVIDPVHEWVEEQVVVKEAAEELVPVPAVYETQEKRIEIEAGHTVWRTGPKPKAKEAPPTLVAAANALGVPESPQPGQCFEEVYEPAGYKTEEVEVVTREATEKIEVTPPKYVSVDRKIVVRDAFEEIQTVEPEYETVTERFLQSPAYTTWKLGSGPVQRIDNATGEIMCLVEVPAEYATVEKQVVKAPATSQRVTVPPEIELIQVQKLIEPAKEKRTPIPAEIQQVERKVKVSEARVSWRPENSVGPGDPTGRKLCLAEVPPKYKTVKTQVVKTPPSVKTVEVPAEYETVRVAKLVSPAQEKRVPVPAEHQMVAKRSKVSPTRQEWRPVLCETNTSRELIAELQAALQEAGFDPGPVDGVLGRGTMLAVDAYQQSKNLPRGGLTIEVLQDLGIEVGRGEM